MEPHVLLLLSNPRRTACRQDAPRSPDLSDAGVQKPCGGCFESGACLAFLWQKNSSEPGKRLFKISSQQRDKKSCAALPSAQRAFFLNCVRGLPWALFHGDLRRLPKRKKRLLPHFTAQRRLDAWASRKGEPFFGAFLQCRSFVPDCFFLMPRLLSGTGHEGSPTYFFAATAVQATETL